MSVGIAKQLRQANRDGGPVQRDDAAAVQIRSGIGSASKLMYCSPAGDSADTWTTLDAGIPTFEVTCATALTPFSVICSDSTRPIRTPRSVDILIGQQATGFR